MVISEFRKKFEEEKIEQDTFRDEKVKVTGRVMRLNSSGAKLIFFDLHEDSSKI